MSTEAGQGARGTGWRWGAGAALFVLTSAVGVWHWGGPPEHSPEPPAGPAFGPSPDGVPASTALDVGPVDPPVAAPGAPAEAPAPGPDRWRVSVVEYARSRAIPRGRLVRGAGGAVDMSWYFFVARRRDRVVLIDCGTDALSRRGAALRARWSIVDAVGVEEALRRVDLRPDQVTDVVVTHHHWDHVGGLGHFDRALVHAHPDEWHSVAGALREPVEASGRLRLTGGPDHPPVEVLPGLHVSEGGRHTAHQIFVSITCDDGPITLVGDAAYLYENIEEALPVTVTTDAAGGVADIAAAAAQVGPRRLLPGHDPEVFGRFPSADPHVGAICR